MVFNKVDKGERMLLYNKVDSLFIYTRVCLQLQSLLIASANRQENSLGGFYV